MKIIELHSENIKNLKAIDLVPGEGEVMLEGKNGAGKSAVLDSIFMALTGTRIEQPIRNGEERAEINVKLGDNKSIDVIIKRVITAKTNRLEVMTKDDLKTPKPKPQELLDKIIGNLSFDPLAFANMKPADQFNLLKEAAGLDTDLMDAEIEGLRGERTIKNREYDTIKKQFAGKIPAVDGLPESDISMADEIAKVKDLEDKRQEFMNIKHRNELLDLKKNTLLKEIQKDRETKLQQQRDVLSRIEDLQRQVEDLDVQIDNLTKEESKVAKEPLPYEIVPEEISVDQINSLRSKLTEIESRNSAIRYAREYRDLGRKASQAKVEADRANQDVQVAEKKKDDAIRTAAMPIEGLLLVGDSVHYNNKPLSQLSTGEKMRVSTAIAMKLNPKLKVIFVRDGSLLDNDGTEEIKKLAADNGYQLWIEKTRDDKSTGIYIEEGVII